MEYRGPPKIATKVPKRSIYEEEEKQNPEAESHNIKLHCGAISFCSTPWHLDLLILTFVYFFVAFGYTHLNNFCLSSGIWIYSS